MRIHMLIFFYVSLDCQIHKDSLCLFANLNEVLYLLQCRGLVLGDWDVVDGEAVHGAAGQRHLRGETDQVGHPLPHQGVHL